MSLIATTGWSQSLTWLGTLGGDWSGAWGCFRRRRRGGRRGYATMLGQRRAFRWTASGGMQDLGTLGGDESGAYGCFRRRRRGGRLGLQRRRAVACHYRWTAFWWHGSPRHAGRLNSSAAYGRFRRRRRGGRRGLQRRRGVVVPFAGRRLVACKTSARCRTAVESDCSGMFPPTAPWWSAGLTTMLGQRRAFRWTASGGMQDLGTLGGNESFAYGVSADGSVVVGYTDNAVGPRAFRWTASGGMQDLGTLPFGNWSVAYGVSADGSVVVGGGSKSVGRSCLSLDGVGRHGRPEHDLCQPADTQLDGFGSAYMPSPPMGGILWDTGLGTPPQIATKLSCWIRASRGAGMLTATAVWTTLTLLQACYSPSAGAATATKTSTGTAQ
jgi:probable HAF family extracellular repeat protein